MSERAGRLLIDGRLVPGRVRFAAGRISAVETNAGADPDAPIVAPGLVDLHGIYSRSSFPTLSKTLLDTARLEPTSCSRWIKLPDERH